MKTKCKRRCAECGAVLRPAKPDPYEPIRAAAQLWQQARVMQRDAIEALRMGVRKLGFERPEVFLHMMLGWIQRGEEHAIRELKRFIRNPGKYR